MSLQQAATLVEFPASQFLSNVRVLADAAFYDSVARTRAGDVDVEEKRCGAALQIQPGHVLANINYGTLLYKRNLFQAALHCYNNAVEGDPTNAMALFNRGNALEEVGRFTDAIKDWNAALEIDPLYADVHYNLARAHERDGRFPRGPDHWTMYISLVRTGKWTDRARKSRKKIL